MALYRVYSPEDGARGHPKVQGQRLDVPCLFGHLALDPGEEGVRPETLYVLGWTDAIAIDPSLETRWSARDLAVDGITFNGVSGPLIRLSVEMDPPGGWFEIELDSATGHERSRAEAFSDDYLGIYGGPRPNGSSG